MGGMAEAEASGTLPPEDSDAAPPDDLFPTAPPAPRARFRSSAQSLRSRLLRSLILLVLFLGVPLIVGVAAGGVKFGEAAALGAIIVLSSSMSNGRQATQYAAPVTLVALTLGAFAKPVPGKVADAPLDGWLWLGVVVLFAMLSGLATQRGAGLAMSMATLYAVVAPPFRDVHSLLILVAWLAAGSLYGWLLARRLGAPESSPAPPRSAATAWRIALFLGVAVGLACLVVIRTDLPHSTWIVTAVVVLGVPTPGFTERKILERMAGQLGACAAVAAATWAISQAPDPAQRALFAAATLLAALLYLMSLGEPVAVQIAFFSAAIMLPIAARGTQGIGDLVGDRLLYNLIGLGILALALAAVRLWADERPAAVA